MQNANAIGVFDSGVGGLSVLRHIRAQLPEVRYVLDGAVTVAGNRQLRISVELEDLVVGRTVWDHDYTAHADETDQFATQSAIAAAVSDALKVAIRADEQRALRELPTHDLRAYERGLGRGCTVLIASHVPHDRVREAERALDQDALEIDDEGERPEDEEGAIGTAGGFGRATGEVDRLTGETIGASHRSRAYRPR